MLNKKGNLLLVVYAVLLLIVFNPLYALATDSNNRINIFRSDLGRLQESINDAYFNTEVELFKSDQLIKYDVYRITNEFGENGGYSKDNLCEKKDGVVVIDFKDCNPDLNANYIELFKKYFDKEIKDLELKDNSLIGELDEVKYDKKGENFEIDYNAANKFKQDTLIDLKFLNELKNRVNSCVERKQDLKDCVGVEFTEKDGYAFFTIENDKNGLMILEGEVVVIKKPAFKFAVKND
ncbi:hypothetical protein HYT57_02510 [Candidatus Woesearchaeota archaeon]|nr:hypothetical protein [Candidatus Woesearchaeota archaeon]